MKKLLSLLFVLIAGHAFAYTANGVGFGDYRPRILTIGDSITSGINTSTDDLGYRRKLQDLLGINRVYMVGQYNTPASDATYQVKTSGLAGDLTSGMLSRLTGVIGNYFSDKNKNQIVLILAGANDVTGSIDTAVAVNHIVSNGSGSDGMVELLLAFNPNVEIYISTLIPFRDSDPSGLAPFNTALTTAVNLKRATYPNIHIVDGHSAFAAYPACSTLSDCFFDTEHPNNTGYDAIGTFFYNCINNHSAQYCDGN